MGKVTKSLLGAGTIALMIATGLGIKWMTGSNDLPAAELLAEADGKAAHILPPAAPLSPTAASTPPRLAPHEAIPPTPSEWSLAEARREPLDELASRRLSFMPKVDEAASDTPPNELIVVEAEDHATPQPVKPTPQLTIVEESSPAVADDPIAERYSQLDAAPAAIGMPAEAPQAVANENLRGQPETATEYLPTNYQQGGPSEAAPGEPAPYRQAQTPAESYRAASTEQAMSTEQYRTVPPAIERRDNWQATERVAQHQDYATPSGNYAAQQDNYYDAGTSRQPVRQVSTGATTDSNAREYVVQPNDNIWKVSEKVYGSGAYFRALIQHNSRWLENPRELRIGDVIRTPSVTELTEKYPDLCPKVRRAAREGNRFTSVGVSRNGPTREYHVQENDTLFDIARFELGQGSRWVEIYELNKGVLTEDFNYLPPGTVLQLPMRVAPEVEDQPDTLTRQPGGTIR